MLLQSLEPRQLLAADIAGDDLNSALIASLQANTTIEFNATIGDGDFGSADVDLFKVDLIAGQSLEVDVDASSLDSGGSLSSLNSYLRVFDSGGGQLATNATGVSSNDGNDGPPTDSYLAFTAPSTGVYYIGVSGETAFLSSGPENTAYDPVVLGTGTPSSTGDYQLQLTAGTPPGQAAQEQAAMQAAQEQAAAQQAAQQAAQEQAAMAAAMQQAAQEQAAMQAAQEQAAAQQAAQEQAAMVLGTAVRPSSTGDYQLQLTAGTPPGQAAQEQARDAGGSRAGRCSTGRSRTSGDGGGWAERDLLQHSLGLFASRIGSVARRTRRL